MTPDWRSGDGIGQDRGVPSDYEYVPLRIPPDVDRLTAAVRLAIQAEFGDWELATVRLFRDGSRQVLLRRRRRRAEPPLPGLSY
jgi:stress response protein SCP2